MLSEKVSLQLSSEQSVGDVRILQLNWKRVPQADRRECRVLSDTRRQSSAK